MQILIFINKWNNGTTSTVDNRDKIYDTKYGNSHRSPRILFHFTLIIKCRISANHGTAKGRISQLLR
jgi:hypothetical protein